MAGTFSIIFVALGKLLILSGMHLLSAEAKTPYLQCFPSNPKPSLVKQSVGVTADAVQSLCLRSSKSISVDFTNADKVFIGNTSQNQGIGTLCIPIVVVVSLNSNNVNFTKVPIPSYLTRQAWALSVWGPAPDPSSFSQQVELKVSNFGKSNLAFDGINFESIGLPRDFKVQIGQEVTLKLNRSQIKLEYNTLPVLQSYLYSILYSDKNPFPPGEFSAAILLKEHPPNNPIGSQVAYAVIKPPPADANLLTTSTQFFLFESTYVPPVPIGNSTSRRLLAVLPGTNRALPAGCPKGCCKPASPIPPTCRPGSPTFSSCTFRCSCFCV